MKLPDVPIVSEELPFMAQLVDDSLIVTLHGAAQLPTGTRITIAVVIGDGPPPTDAPPTDAPPTVEAPAVPARKYMGDGAQ